MARSIPKRFRHSIECGAPGESVVLTYGDADTGITERIVDINDVFLSGSSLFIEGFCHLKLATRTFRHDRVHRIYELSQSGSYENVVDWLASYGASVELYWTGSIVGCRLTDPGHATK